MDPENLGANLQITAQAFDGTVEAIELDTPDRMVLGVQFHPERMDDLAAKIFKKLCSQATLYRQNQQ